MTAAPVPIRATLERARASGADEARLADERVRVLHEMVEDALGPLAGRATCDIDELAAVFPTLGRSSLYELARTELPTISVGRRRLVSVVGLCALLLGVEPEQNYLDETNAGPDSRRSSRSRRNSSDVTAE
jgi:hypothetical protein